MFSPYSANLSLSSIGISDIPQKTIIRAGMKWIVVILARNLAELSRSR